jgi:hypothetical protein
MRSLSIAFLLVAAACAEPSPVGVDEQAAPGEGVADVVGRVLTASGAPVSGDVTIRCAADAFGATVPIDAQGHYHAALVAPVIGRVECVFTAPAGIRLETSIGLGRSGLPHALQIVDLRA